MPYCKQCIHVIMKFIYIYIYMHLVYINLFFILYAYKSAISDFFLRMADFMMSSDNRAVKWCLKQNM